MLRSVLTPAELEELGLSNISNGFENPNQKLDVRQLLQCRRFLCQAMLTASIPPLIALRLICSKHDPLALMVIGAAAAFQVVSEVTVSIAISDGSITAGDMVALLLGIVSRTATLGDLFFVVHCFRLGANVPGYTSIGCLVFARILIAGLVLQVRGILSLYMHTDDFGVDKLDTFFSFHSRQQQSMFVDSDRWAGILLSRQNITEVGIPSRQRDSSFAERADVTVSRFPPRTISRSSRCKSSLLVILIRAAFRDCCQICKRITQKSLPNNREESSHAETELSVVQAKGKSPSSTSGVCDTTRLQSHEEDDWWKPLTANDALVFSWQYAGLLSACTYILGLERLWTATARLLRIRTPYRRTGRSPSSSSSSTSSEIRGGGQVARTFSSPLINQETARRITPTESEWHIEKIAKAWVEDFENVRGKRVLSGRQAVQIANLCHSLDYFYLQNVLRRQCILPDDLEANEFAASWVSLGRCFLSDLMLCVLKCYVALETWSLLPFALMWLSLVSAAGICGLNVADAWAELLAFE